MDRDMSERILAREIVHFIADTRHTPPGELVEHASDTGELRYTIRRVRGRGYQHHEIPAEYARAILDMIKANASAALGARSSERKAAASRLNGRKGGRPRKTPPAGRGE